MVSGILICVVDAWKKGFMALSVILVPSVWDSSLTRKIDLLAAMISAESGVRLFCASGV